ncbi:HD domain-containing protein [Actinomycetospora soli]|uniref:HD domain-containing protein n=1 Tax=Actinomycetospora soli TaxID=2893887 RepID=UPI001E550ADB|nr:HD domain-containing protein [Actinomycetospora soli]MCD2191345.1 HD domain-containing protein [Actinomycetospora soli]
MSDDVDGVVTYAYEVGHLARSPRAGWQLGFVRDPESVAEHSHRAAVLAYLIAHLEGADAERAATLALFHDVPETRSTDLHSVAKRYTAGVDPEQIAKDQTVDMPSRLAGAIQRIIADVEAKSTRESVCAKDADKLDCLLRAREYQAQGYTHLQPWVDNMIAGMRTETGRALAEKAAVASPGEWWHDTAASYGLPGQAS